MFGESGSEIGGVVGLMNAADSHIQPFPSPLSHTNHANLRVAPMGVVLSNM